MSLIELFWTAKKGWLLPLSSKWTERLWIIQRILESLAQEKPNLLGMGGVAQDSQMDWMRGRTDGPADYIRREDRPRYLLLFLTKQGSRSARLSPQSMIHYARKLFKRSIRIVQSFTILETTRWPGDQMTRWPDDILTRWVWDYQITIFTRWPE